MTKLGILFIILIIAGVLLEAALLFKVITIPKDFSSILPIDAKPNEVKIENIAPAGGSVTQVTLTNSGFEPSTIRVKLGDKIIWTNKTGSDASVNSDPHPTHETNNFLNLGEVKPGETVRVIVRQIGSFSYHNHLNPSQKRIIIVE